MDEDHGGSAEEDPADRPAHQAWHEVQRVLDALPKLLPPASLGVLQEVGEREQLLVAELREPVGDVPALLSAGP